MLSKDIAALPSSPISAVFERATALRAEGRDLINLSVGEPDFDTPAHICEAGIAAIRGGATRYTPADGTAEIKDAIRRKFERDNDLRFSAAEVAIGAGAKTLLAALVRAAVDPGDEVLIPTPCWSSHPGMTQLAGATARLLPTDLAAGFKITPAQLSDAITPRSRILILCSPSNPTGAVYSAEELAALAEALRAAPERLLVISDDLYEHIVFDGAAFATLAAVAPDLGPRIMTVNGVSKAYAMTGWRIGYAGGPKWWLDGVRAIYSHANGASSAISVKAAVAALDGPQDVLAEWRGVYQRRRDVALEGLAAIDGLDVARPDGAFYLLPHSGALLGRKRPDGREIASSIDLADHLLEAGVVVVPGPAFSCDPYFRMSTAASEAQIVEATTRMARAISELA